MKFKNVIAALRDQGPWRRFFVNFFVTRNAWGLFHVNSHVSQGTGKPKVAYGSKYSAEKAAAAMQRKHGSHYSAYKCMRCDGFHLGRNRSSK